MTTLLGLDSYSLALTMEDPADPRDALWFLERVVEFGLDGCQIDPRHLREWNSTLLDRIGAFCDSRGLYLELGTWRFDFARVSAQLEEAARIGARALRTFHGGIRQRMSADEIRAAMERSIEGLKRLADTAEKVGVPLALENHEEFRSEEIEEILAAVNSPGVGACLDTGNGMPLGEDPLETVDRLIDRAVCIHWKDWAVRLDGGMPSWEDRPLGGGDARAREVLDRIRRRRPDLPITIEVPTRGSNRPVAPEREMRNVAASVAFAKSLVRPSVPDES